MLFSGMNFRSYLEEYAFWNDEYVRSKKRFKTILMTLYGKKKDRGRIKKKYKQKIEEYNRQQEVVKDAIRKVAPSLFSLCGLY